MNVSSWTLCLNKSMEKKKLKKRSDGRQAMWKEYFEEACNGENLEGVAEPRRGSGHQSVRDERRLLGSEAVRTPDAVTSIWGNEKRKKKKKETQTW